MHMMSKKDLSTDERETLRRSTNPTTALTANGKVQTNEEAQVYVYDLDLFVTVQFLGDTLAVLSLGKLCEEHGYTCEWVSGQQPHLTNKGRGFSARRWYQFVSYIVTAGLIKYISSSAATEQSGDGAQGTWRDAPKTKKKKEQRWSIGKPIARPPAMVGEVHRKSRRCSRSACRLENSAKTTDIPLSVSAVKNHG